MLKRNKTTVYFIKMYITCLCVEGKISDVNFAKCRDNAWEIIIHASVRIHRGSVVCNPAQAVFCAEKYIYDLFVYIPLHSVLLRRS